MVYTVKKLAELAGVSRRTLHYYDELGILKPLSRRQNGYRIYGEDAIIQLQQIMFFRELDFSLDDIRKILSRPDFNVLEALQSHKILLTKKAECMNTLLATVDQTIQQLKGKTTMPIKDYYQGFSDEQVEKYREEVRKRWGDLTLRESEERVLEMGKEKFAALQSEGQKIFQGISDNMRFGPESDKIQALVAKWRLWLENFHHYSPEAVLGLGQMYSQNPEFAVFFRKIHPDLPEFFTQAIEYYCSYTL